MTGHERDQLGVRLAVYGWGSEMRDELAVCGGCEGALPCVRFDLYEKDGHDARLRFTVDRKHVRGQSEEPRTSVLSRRRWRWSLPVTVRGSVATYSICRGYL